MRNVKRSWFMMLLMVLVLVTACQKDQAVKEDAVVPAYGDVVSAPEDEAIEDPVQEILEALLSGANSVVISDTHVTFKDDSGREDISILRNPQKVAVLYGSHACLYTEAGGFVSVGIGGSGAEALYMEQLGRNILEDEGVVTVATTGSAKNWDIEAILAEKPDLIICSTAMSGYATISGPAEAVGIPVIAMTYSGISDYLKYFKVFNALNQESDLWDSIAMETAQEVAMILSKAPVDNNPRVLSILPQSKGATANLSASDMGAIIKELNGINVADALNSDSSLVRIDISIEDIFAANPDMIFIQSIGSQGEAEALMEELFGDNPVWESLEAVKNNKVYYMPKLLFHNRPNRQYNASYRMMAEYLYPDVQF